MSQLWKSQTTQGALRIPLIILLYLLLALKLWSWFAEGTCSAFRNVSRLVIPECVFVESFALPHRL